jgi:hypothetical protein
MMDTHRCIAIGRNCLPFRITRIHFRLLKKTKVTLQRRAMIQNLSNLTKKLPLRSLTMQGAVSMEITEIIWIWPFRITRVHFRLFGSLCCSCAFVIFCVISVGCCWFVSVLPWFIFCPRLLFFYNQGSKTASDHLSSGCCQPAHVCCRFFFLILRVFGRPMGYHDNHWKKPK